MKGNYVSIGYTKKAHGARGELKVLIKEEYLEDFLHSEVIFINIQGKPAPFFVEELRESNDLIMKLEDVDNPKDAAMIASKEVFLRKEDLLPDGDHTPPASSLQFEKYRGFMLVDEHLGRIGEIKEVLEFPQQEMAVVACRGNDLLIPLHDSLVTGVDEEAKTITLNLPSGLLDI